MIKVKSNIRYLLLLVSTLVLIIGLLFKSPLTLAISTFLLLAHNIFYTFENFIERTIFFSFNATFFVFLMGRVFVTTFFKYNLNTNLFGLAFNNLETVNHILISFYISLLCLFLGHNWATFRKFSQKEQGGHSFWFFFRKVSKYFFYFTLIFRFLYLIDISRFVSSYDYFEYYLSYSSSLPGLFIRFASMYDVAFFSFLASEPKKRESLIPISLYIIEGVFSLRTGQRANFMMNILIILIYVVICNRKKLNARKWFTKKVVISCIVVFPLLMVILNNFGQQRGRSGELQYSYTDSFLHFFYAQGVSANVIGYTKELSDYIPKGKVYSIGPFFEFTNNLLGNRYYGQTSERALNGFLFSHTISYLIMPDMYLRGSGYGSSFIAELYHDLGYIGIIVGSFGYGILLRKLFCWYLSNRYLRIFMLLMTRSLLFIPRAGATSFLVSTFALENIVGIAMITLITLVVKDILGNFVSTKKINRLELPQV